MKHSDPPKLKHCKAQIVYRNNKPYGIRDESGFLLFFTQVSKFPNQEERYRKEVEEQFKMADYILSSLKDRTDEALTG